MLKNLCNVIEDFKNVCFFHDRIHTAIVSQGHFYCNCKKCNENRNSILKIVSNYSVSCDFTKKECFIYGGVEYCDIMDIANSIDIEI